MEEIFYEIFESLPRQGPGDDESTKRAFQKLTELPANPAILDVGCGNGSQTMALAKLTSGKITALDNHQPFIEILKNNARQAGYLDKLRCVVGDMASMNFAEGSFDLIWSEGAVFIMGFNQAISRWNALLKPKGYMVISEMVWFEEKAPQEIKDYFTEVYPAIQYYENHLHTIKICGYKIIDGFPLPSESWWQNYYTPAEKKIAELRIKYQGNDTAKSIFDSLQLEIDMFRKYSKYYGYYFYVMQKAW